MELKKHLLEYGPAQMEAFAEELGERPFRGRQLLSRIYSGAVFFEEMTELPAGFRRRLSETAVLRTAVIRRVLRSEDGTVKYLLGLSGGGAVETVFMKYRHGNTVCLSSQAGCRMGCVFCASGMKGLQRNLTAGEMMEQVLTVRGETGEPVSGIVLMGTGEPFDNYEQVKAFLKLAGSKEALGMSMRAITVSTCGIPGTILRFAGDFPQVNLAVSLHAPDDAVRGRIMPAGRAMRVEELIRTCREYTGKTRRRITFEYALIRDINDGRRHAEKLAGLLRGMLCHVNLIPLNPVAGTGLRSGGRKAARMFQEVLEEAGVAATIRRELGADISAACGQLRLEET